MNDVVGSENLVGNGQLPLGYDLKEPTAGSSLILFS